MNYDIIIPENYDIIIQKATKHHLTSVSLVHQAKWPANPPPCMLKVQFLQSLGAKMQFLKVQSLPINMGLFLHKFSAHLGNLCPIFFSHFRVRERREKG